MKSPGRPKGTRVTLCTCGRRVAGPLGKRATCPGPDCGKRVTIRVRTAKTKKVAVYLEPK